MPLRNDLATAKAIDEQTGGLAPTAGVAGSTSEGPVAAAEVEQRLAFVRKLLLRLSRGLSDDIEVSEDTVRLHRQLQATWEFQIAPLVAGAARYPAEMQRRLQLVTAERDKISREVDTALEAASVEQQLTKLQRCTRQLESAQAADAPDPALVHALTGRLGQLVVEVRDARAACHAPAANEDIDALLAHAECAAAKPVKPLPAATASRRGAGADGGARKPVSASIFVSSDDM